LYYLVRRKEAGLPFSSKGDILIFGKFKKISMSPFADQEIPPELIKDLFESRARRNSAGRRESRSPTGKRKLSKKCRLYIETEKVERITFARALPRRASRAITFLADAEAISSPKSRKVIRFARV